MGDEIDVVNDPGFTCHPAANSFLWNLSIVCGVTGNPEDPRTARGERIFDPKNVSRNI